MRYYSITITNPKTGEVIRPAAFSSLKLPDSYTSYVNGKTLGAALNVEIQASIAQYAIPKGGTVVRIWGISLQEISQANNLNGMNIVVKAGMQKGLPLANPSQNGIIIRGTIFQAFGNWEGTNMTLDLIIIPNTGSKNLPKNFTFKWKAKTPLADAIKTTLQAALPDMKTKIAISPNLVLNNDENAVFSSLVEFSKFIARISSLKQFQGIKPKSGGTYQGVAIVSKDNTIVVSDGTADVNSGSSYDKPTQVLFQDLIGQPTWLSPTLLNFRCVMRADISVGDFVKLPSKLGPGSVGTSSGISNTPATDKAAFSGVFGIREVYHFGNFRQPDAASWCTSFEAFFIKTPAPATLTPAGQSSLVAQAFDAPADSTATITDQKVQDAFNAPDTSAQGVTASNNQKIQDAFNAPSVPSTTGGPLSGGGV